MKIKLYSIEVHQQDRAPPFLQAVFGSTVPLPTLNEPMRNSWKAGTGWEAVGTSFLSSKGTFLLPPGESWPSDYLTMSRAQTWYLVPWRLGPSCLHFHRAADSDPLCVLVLMGELFSREMGWLPPRKKIRAPSNTKNPHAKPGNIFP